MSTSSEAASKTIVENALAATKPRLEKEKLLPCCYTEEELHDMDWGEDEHGQLFWFSLFDPIKKTPMRPPCSHEQCPH